MSSSVSDGDRHDVAIPVGYGDLGDGGDGGEGLGVSSVTRA